MNLSLGDFPAFIREVHRHRPFPWQDDYLKKVVAQGRWLDLDIPTGLGKTTVIDVWVFLLAWQYVNGHDRTVPLRLFFVVDRRLVVDQAYEHARRLSAALDSASEGTVAHRVGRALAELGRRGEALEVIRMRGGVDWASRWLTSPAQPAVITSTVDQYGSRLLFRGYHTSPRMRPIDAALCGMDALVAVDEAHIALPLLVTAADCAAYQHTAAHPAFADRAVQVVSLSATASTAPDRPRHRITDDDRNHDVAGRRLNAPRRVICLDAVGTAKDAATAFATSAVQALDVLLPVLERSVAAVVANTIRTARATHQLLSQREDIEVVLLTGRSRALDRERLLAEKALRELLAGLEPGRGKPLVVVATQTVEVGLDVSFAALITENASHAALVQRLGRLDRTGERTLAPAIVVRAADGSGRTPIPVYGDAAARTWNWLTTHTPALQVSGLDPADLAKRLPQGLLVNPVTLPVLLDGVDTALLNTPAPRIPVLHRTLLNAWSGTGPVPVPDQDVAPFLHGLDTSPEDVQVLWRADLPFTDDSPDFERWALRLQQLPPHPGETVSLPAGQLRRFLTQEPDGGDDTSDLEGAPHSDPAPTRQKRPSVMSPVMRLDEAEDRWVAVTAPDGIRPGSTVVLPSSYGGHDPYGWTGTRSTPVADLGDFPPTRTAPTATALIGTAVTRLDPAVLTVLAGGAADLHAVLNTAMTKTVKQLTAGEDDPALLVDTLLDALLGHLNARPGGPYTDLARIRLAELRAVEDWSVSPTGRTTTRGHVVLDPYSPHRLLLVPPHAPAGQPEQSAGIGDESADASSLTRPVPLPQHSRAVAERAAAFATALNLPTDLIDTLHTAGHAHDCGKAHSRFQCMLCAGDRLLAESLDEPLAKSGMDPADHTARRRAAQLAQWKTEMRHEALSALAVTAWLATGPAHPYGTDKDLLVHLVAAHHGHARPLLPPVPDPQPQDVICTMPDQQQITVNSADMGTDWNGPDRFHARNRAYGPWGLALLEAVLRLADMACSEEGT